MTSALFLRIGTGTERGWRVYALVRPVAWPDLRAALQNMEAKNATKIQPFSPWWIIYRWWDEEGNIIKY